MSHPDCILEEVNPISNQKVVNCEEPIEEICTPDFYVDGCECFLKQEQKIKELQAELDRQYKIHEEKKRKQVEEEKRKQEVETKRKQEEEKKRKLEEETKRKQKEKEDKERKMEVIRVKLNEFATLANEQQKIADQKHKEYMDANRKYYEYYGEYNKYKYEYESLNNNRNPINDPVTDLFRIFFNPNIKF